MSGAEEPDEALPPAAALLGRRMLEFDPATGGARLEFLARPEFANRHGFVQGGMLSAMLDSATGSVLMAGLPPGLTAVTTELRTSFLKPAPLGPLRAEVRVVSKNERDAEMEAELSAPSGEVVARATATLRILKRR